MEINGIKYVKEEKINNLIAENDTLKKENKKLIELLKKCLPLEEKEISYLMSCHGLTYIRHKIGENGYYGNERLEYESKISKLSNEITALKSNITKLEKQYKSNNDGTINLKKADEKKLLEIKKLIDEIIV